MGATSRQLRTIAFVSTDDPRSRLSWSGTTYRMWRALADKGYRMELIGPLERRYGVTARLRKLAFQAVGSRHMIDRERSSLVDLACQVEKHLRGKTFDLVMSPGTLAIAHLHTTKPLVFWADATFDGMLDYYKSFRSVTSRSRVEGSAAEELALVRSSLALYASEWAAESAIRRYSVARERVHVVPFGANCESGWDCNQARASVNERRCGECRLLFVGMDWYRKGGDLAISVAEHLRRQGVPAWLDLLGAPPPNPLPSFVRFLGRADVSTAEGLALLRSAFSRAHFLLLPARAEAYGIVLCEASSFGVPSLATRTGGVPTIVREGRNGYLFDPGAAAKDYAITIERLFRDWPAYAALAQSAFDEYAARLSWEGASATASKLIESL